VRRQLAALGCLATIAVADHVIQRRRPRWIVAGMFDEPAHVATALLLRRNPTPAYLAGSLLPDFDHIPLALRLVHPDPGDPRPVTHCLLTVAPVAALNRDAAKGMLAHFVRDLAVGTGVPLLWPFTRRRLRVPYTAYAVLVLATAYSRSRPFRAAPAHIPGASGRGP
jgi:LexA-binding, inner membrane-associated putative hydrolase